MSGEARVRLTVPTAEAADDLRAAMDRAMDVVNAGLDRAEAESKEVRPGVPLQIEALGRMMLRVGGEVRDARDALEATRGVRDPGPELRRLLESLAEVLVIAKIAEGMAVEGIDAIVGRSAEGPEGGAPPGAGAN